MALLSIEPPQGVTWHCCPPRRHGNTRHRLWLLCHGDRQHRLWPHRHEDTRQHHLLCNFGNRHCCLLPHHFAIRGIIFCCAVTALHGVITHHAAMAIHSVIFGRAAMAIGGIVFSLTAMGIHGIIICCATLAIGIFALAAPLQ